MVIEGRRLPLLGINVVTVTCRDRSEAIIMGDTGRGVGLIVVTCGRRGDQPERCRVRGRDRAIANGASPGRMVLVATLGVLAWMGLSVAFIIGPMLSTLATIAW